MRLEYFQMLDGIVRLDPEAGEIETRCIVPDDSPVFEGHFPGHPLMPGVLLIETMAQTCGTMIMARNGFEKLPLLIGVKGAKLRKYVEPKEVLNGHGIIEHDGSGFAVAKAEIKRGGAKVSNAELTYTLIDWPHPDLKTFMLDLIDRLKANAAGGLLPAPDSFTSK